MPAEYNIKNQKSPEDNYQSGLLPQRNQPGLYYRDSSCRSNFTNFSLSSENRRILKKTEQYTYQTFQPTFPLNIVDQKTILRWIKGLGWEFPINSVKTVFTRHIFNHFYTWSDANRQVVGYSACFRSLVSNHPKVASIAYVFYDPRLQNSNLPIRMVLQEVINSHDQGYQYCYLGRFQPPSIGYYKRNLPGFEYYSNSHWLPYQSSKK